MAAPSVGFASSLRCNERRGGCPCASGSVGPATGGEGGGTALDVYEIRRVTPPAQDLGTHLLPTNTQCGEVISCAGRDWVVNSVLYRYRLRGGKYWKARLTRCVAVLISRMNSPPAYGFPLLFVLPSSG